MLYDKTKQFAAIIIPSTTSYGGYNVFMCPSLSRYVSTGPRIIKQCKTQVKNCTIIENTLDLKIVKIQMQLKLS